MSPLGGSEGVSTFRVVVLRCERNLSDCSPLSGRAEVVSVNAEYVFPGSDLKFRGCRESCDIHQIIKFPSLS